MPLCVDSPGHHAAVLVAGGALALAGVGAVAGCGGDTPAAGAATASPGSAAPEPAHARAQLAGMAAAAQDRHAVARYRLSADGAQARTVTVSLANDGTWRVDVPGGALGGTADVSVVRTAAGLYQCAQVSIGSASPGCVRLAGPEGRIKAAYDPRVQHPFTDWLAVLTDRQAALAVSTAKRPAGVRGSCFSVESSSASLAAPLDLGIYCFEQDGTLTGATLSFGTLVLEGTPGSGPETVPLPGPVADGEPLPVAAEPAGETAEPTSSPAG